MPLLARFSERHPPRVSLAPYNAREEVTARRH
jgi:hypothetical protein